MGASARLTGLLLLGLVAGLAAPGSGVSGAEPQSAHAAIGWIEIAPVPQHKDQIVIAPQVYASEASSGRFTLTVSRVGKGGTTNTRQSGVFNVSAGESRKLSTTSVNIMPAEALTIELKLYSGDKEVFSVVMKTASDRGARDI